MWVLLGLGARHAGGLAQPAQPGRRQRELSALIAQERKGRLPGVRTLFFHLSQTVRMLGVRVCFGDICEIGLPSWYQVKNPPTKAGDVGSIPGSGRCPGGGNGKPLWYSCLGNAIDRGAWRDAVHGVTKSWNRFGNFTTENSCRH